jgi:nucleoside-diphosphate-sugar epimerase
MRSRFGLCGFAQYSFTMPRVFIAGCGFVGLATARLFHRSGWEVVACTHSAESARALGGEDFDVEAVDIADVRALGTVAARGPFDVVVHCASSGKGGADQYRLVYLQGARTLIEALAPGFMLFTSSTSVYAQVSGEEVTEESDATPDRETGRVLRETEDLVVKSGGAAARLAGIYGPGRSVLLKKFFSGEAVIEGDGTRWINQIHRDDAAAALLAIANARTTGIFNVVDDLAIAQRELYHWLAARFDRPLPPTGPIDPNRKRGWTHKRVANSKLRALGWKPQYPSFFTAVEQDADLVPAAIASVGGQGN